MRKLVVLVMLVAVGCSRGPAAQGPASSAATAPASSTSAVSPSSLPRPTGELLYAVFEPPPSAGPAVYTKVAIVGLDGFARAKATFTPLAPVYVGCAGPTLPQQGYAVGGKVYFADGSGTIRTLDRSGALSVIASFPIGAQQELSFAVSPDAKRLLATVLTHPPKPDGNACSGAAFAPGNFVVDTYAVTVGAAPKLIDHKSTPYASNQPQPQVLQFMGWDAVGPLALYPAGLGTQGVGPTHWYGHPVRTDLSGRVLGDLGGAACPAAMDAGADGTVVCIDQNGTDVRRPDGSVAWHSADPVSAGRLSPDRQRVVGFGNEGQVVVAADGTITTLFGEFFVTGWLDPVTVIGNFNPGGEVGIGTVAPSRKPAAQGYGGIFVGVVQNP
jgi:hypothetical protein